MIKEELRDINTKVPQTISYLTTISTKLLEEVHILQYERDEYRKKYKNEAELRRTTNKLLNNL